MFEHEEAVICGPEEASDFATSQVRYWPRSRVDLALAACQETRP